MTATAAGPVAEDLERLTCKCCGGTAAVYGAVEFNRTCEDREVPVFPPSGVDIPYHRCSACGFIFTIAFDHFGAAEFGQYIYNDAYPLADPDFADRRPASNAELLRRNFGAAAGRLRVLDYGGGNGLLARRLQELGFTGAATYDPFYAGSSRPQGTFDLITAFEVLEHTTTPRDTLVDMASLLSPEGMLLCSTLVQPPDIDQLRLRWWYAAPRNGHVSLYSPRALTALAASAGLTYGGGNELLHVFHRGTLPAFATQLVTA
ncbi:MAG: class I SAM-dependent methyltransferase [Gemmatimonadetes bacterium]|nr:class I SAM-dependent methyltransferase [Gemmatimonadota bacterium]